MGRNIRQLIFDFHINQNAVSDGKELLVNGNMVNMVIAVTGNAQNFNLVVEAKANDTDTYTAISVVNADTLDISSNITANGKYIMSLEGYVKVRIKLSAIGANAVSVKGTITD